MPLGVIALDEQVAWIVLGYAAVVASSVWVFLDVRGWSKRPAQPGDTGSRDPSKVLPAWAWLAGCLVLWIVFFPSYLTVTKQWDRWRREE